MDTNQKYILGISFGYHDSAVALLTNGKVLSAVEEERFTGIKHDSSFPHHSIKWITKEHNITVDDISYVCFYENPTLKNDRNKSIYRKYWYKNLFGFKLKDKSFDDLKNYFPKAKVMIGNHHLSHLAYSYYTSPFKSSALLSVDGVGEWDTTVMATGDDDGINTHQSIQYPHSLGMLYSTITAFLGFKPNEGEYKVMGLAPYGKENLSLSSKFDSLITKKHGGYELNLDYFSYHYSDDMMFSSSLSNLLGLPNRLPNEPIKQIHKDLALILQQKYEEVFFYLLRNLYVLTGSKNLCLGGGCAYNGTANGKIQNETEFEKIWIPPAPSDAGSAIGAALFLYYHLNPNSERIDNCTPFLGPSEKILDVVKVLQKNEKRIYFEALSEKQLLPKVAKLISEGNIIGWVQNKLEFGARALGNRSILADPRDPQMKQRVNSVVKKREGFRPFAPMVTSNDMHKFFTPDIEIPYMNQIVKVQIPYRSKLPAITHIDGSARVQTLRRTMNPKMFNLLKQYEKITKYPILLNTSFNLKDQTMVRDSQEAIDTFMNCDLDYLVIDNLFISKKII